MSKVSPYVKCSCGRSSFNSAIQGYCMYCKTEKENSENLRYSEPYLLEEIKHIKSDNLACVFPDVCVARLIATIERLMKRDEPI